MAGVSTALVCVHNLTTQRAKEIELLTPSKVTQIPLATYLWAPFDKLSSVCSFARDNTAFGSAIVDGAI